MQRLADHRLIDNPLTEEQERARNRGCPHCRPELFRSTERGWHQRKGPMPVLHARTRTSGWCERRRWLDHLWRFRHDDGRWTYVAEPYGLHYEDVADDLSWLDQQGYDITISSAHARHYPGQTVAIHITERTNP